MCDSFKYNLIIIIRKLIKSLSNSIMYVFIFRKVVNNLNDLIHFFWCVFQINTGELIEILCIFIIWDSFRWCKASFFYFLIYIFTTSFVVILITLILSMINRFNISLLIIRKHVLKTNNIETRSLYSIVSLTISTVICKRIFLIMSWFFNSTIIIK